MSKLYETTIKLNAALGRQYAQTFAAAQKLTNGLSEGLVNMQTRAANMSGLAGLGSEIQELRDKMREAGGGTEEQTNKLRYLMNEYATLSTTLNGTVVAFDEARENANKLTNAFEEQEIASKNLAQTEQALGDVKGVIAQRKELERLKKLYERMPNKQLENDIKAQEKALARLESQTGLTGRSMAELENRQRLLLRNQSAQRFSASAQKAFAGVKKAAGVVAKGVGIAVAAIASAVAGAVAALGRLTNEVGAKLADTEQRARQFGMDTDMFQGFEYSMKKNGVERDQYIDGLQTLQEKMSEALKEPGEMRDNFAKLGITMEDLKNKNVGEVFKQMSGNAHMLGTEVEQTKMGLDMLGGEGGKIMAAMAKEGIAGMEKDFEEAKRMGAVATEDQIKNAAKYQEQVNKMSAAWDGVKMTIANAVLPVFTKLLDKVSKWLEENPDAIQKLGENIERIANKVEAFFSNSMIPNIGTTISFFQKLIDTIVSIGISFLGPVALIIKNFDKIKKAWGACVEAVKKAWDKLTSVWQAGVEVVANGIAFWVDAFLSIPDKIASLKTTLTEFFTGMWDGIKDTFKSAINWIITKINGLSFTVPDWVPEFGGETMGFNIPLLASGGIATKATTAVVGEGAEPEAILPLSKLKGLLGGEVGGLTVNVSQSITINGNGNVEDQARKGASAGAQDLAAQIDAIMKRKYRLAM